MKVLYLSRELTSHDHRFLAANVEAGHQPYFLRLDPPGRRLDPRPLPKGAKELEWLGGRRPFSWGQLPQLVDGLREVLTELQPDIIHAGPIPTLGFIAARAGFHPLTLMSWGSDLLLEARRNVFKRALTRYALARADSLITDCEAVTNAATNLGFPRRRIASFPWGLDLNEFRPSEDDGGIRKNLGWEGKFVILHTRSWEKLYGIETVARGFARAAQQNQDLRLLLIGGGSQESNIRRILQNAGVLGSAHFTGQVPLADLPAYYHAADLYVSATLSDGTSVSLMEALASGVPVLVSAVGGNLEWVRPGQDGWLFPAGNSLAFAKALLHAASPGDTIQKMSKAARKRAEEKADWQQNKLGIQQAYKLAREHANA